MAEGPFEQAPSDLEKVEAGPLKRGLTEQYNMRTRSGEPTEGEGVHSGPLSVEWVEGGGS